MKKQIHVNQFVLRNNKKNGTNDPVLSVRTYKGVELCREVNILGPSKLIYRPEKPLSCGASLWIETTAEVELLQ